MTDQASITAATERIRTELSRIDMFVNNAAISQTGRRADATVEEYAQSARPSNVSLDEVRVVWETSVFGALAVYSAMLPLLRDAPQARIVNVPSGVGSLTMSSDPDKFYRSTFGPIYPASKMALNAITLAMASSRFIPMSPVAPHQICICRFPSATCPVSINNWIARCGIMSSFVPCIAPYPDLNFASTTVIAQPRQAQRWGEQACIGRLDWERVGGRS